MPHRPVHNAKCFQLIIHRQLGGLNEKIPSDELSHSTWVPHSAIYLWDFLLLPGVPPVESFFFSFHFWAAGQQLKIRISFSVRATDFFNSAVRCEGPIWLNGGAGKKKYSPKLVENLFSSSFWTAFGKIIFLTRIFQFFRHFEQLWKKKFPKSPIL